MSFNKIIIVGNLGRDPELRYTPQGTAVCNISIATSEKKKDKTGELQDITTWFRVTLWRNQAELASKYLTKGSQVYIEGHLRVEEWKDREGGQRYTLEVQGTDMQFIGSGGRTEDYSSQSSNQSSGYSGDADDADGADSSNNFAARASADDDDIPF